MWKDTDVEGFIEGRRPVLKQKEYLGWIFGCYLEFVLEK